MSTQTAIAALLVPLFGRTVIATDKHGATASYTLARLSDKIGTLKDGSKGEYVVMTKNGDEAVVINIHPNTAKKLATKGEGDMLKLLPASSDVESLVPSAAEQDSAKALMAGDPEPAAADPVPQDEVTNKSAKEPSKKDRTIAIYTSMIAQGKVRKDIIAKMKTDLGLSAAGANTYYQNCKSGNWK